MIFVRIRKFDGEYPFRLDKRIPFQLRKDHRVDVKPSACVLGVHHEVELFFYLRKVIRIAFHFQAFESELFFAGIRRGEQQGVLLLFEQLLPVFYRLLSLQLRRAVSSDLSVLHGGVDIHESDIAAEVDQVHPFLLFRFVGGEEACPVYA